MVPERQHPNIHLMESQRVLLLSFDFYDLFYQMCFDSMNQLSVESDCEQMEIVTRVLLTLNPEMNTAINRRY